VQIAANVAETSPQFCAIMHAAVVHYRQSTRNNT